MSIKERTFLAYILIFLFTFNLTSLANCESAKIADEYVIKDSVNGSKNYNIKILKRDFYQAGLTDDVLFTQHLVAIKDLSENVGIKFPRNSSFTELLTVICEKGSDKYEVRLQLPSFSIQEAIATINYSRCEGSLVDKKLNGECNLTITSPAFNFPPSVEHLQPPTSTSTPRIYSFTAIPVKK